MLLLNAKQKGYENNDWYIKTPVLKSDTPIDLSPETIDETLKYFVLSADRLSQMTKTYNDIEAVTKLLEEVLFAFSSFLLKNSNFVLFIERTRFGTRGQNWTVIVRTK